MARESPSVSRSRPGYFPARYAKAAAAEGCAPRSNVHGGPGIRREPVERRVAGVEADLADAHELRRLGRGARDGPHVRDRARAHGRVPLRRQRAHRPQVRVQGDDLVVVRALRGVRARSGARRLVHVPRARLDDVRGACRAAGKRQPRRRATHRSAVDSWGQPLADQPHLLLVSIYFDCACAPSRTSERVTSQPNSCDSGFGMSPGAGGRATVRVSLVSYWPLALCARPGVS